NQFDYSGTYTIRFNYKITVTKPSYLKVKTTGSTSLKLYWSKVSGVSGYQLQQKSGSSYKTIANTKSIEFTVKNLKPASSYSFRLRAYKTVGGQKYYSSWVSLTAVTKPGTVSIKTPTTNTKHQLTAKWSAASGVSGYQVQFCRYKNFSSSVTTKTLSGSKYTSYTLGGFTKGRVYYIRVRAYKTVNNTRYYGNWSAVKSITCK
ncbi:MAG: fibronectin type III domain-containing protein, partial [Acutalibacteraceae bacterium]